MPGVLHREWVGKTKAESNQEKGQILWELFASADSFVAAWAGKRLHCTPGVPADFFWNRLGNSRLSTAQMELDWALLELDSERWRHSAERFDLFKRALRSRTREDEAKRIFAAGVGDSAPAARRI